MANLNNILPLVKNLPSQSAFPNNVLQGGKPPLNFEDLPPEILETLPHEIETFTVLRVDTSYDPDSIPMRLIYMPGSDDVKALLLCSKKLRIIAKPLIYGRIWWSYQWYYPEFIVEELMGRDDEMARRYLLGEKNVVRREEKKANKEMIVRNNGKRIRRYTSG